MHSHTELSWGWDSSLNTEFVFHFTYHYAHTMKKMFYRVLTVSGFDQKPSWGSGGGFAAVVSCLPSNLSHFGPF